MGRVNAARARLAAGRIVFGALIAAGAPELVEIAAQVGFDFVTIDAEHEPIDDARIAHLIRAAEAFDVSPIVRLPLDTARITHALDAGAQGIHVAHCSTPSDVKRVVDATRFSPVGNRTFYNLGRSGRYSRGTEDSAWAREANSELLVIVMVEDVAAIAVLDEILQVPGYDAIHIGPKDLWQSMGMPDQPAVDAAVSSIVQKTVAADRWVSLQLRITADVESIVATRRSQGAAMITLPLFDFILYRAPELLDVLRAGEAP